jgi:hypothetical protein
MDLLNTEVSFFFKINGKLFFGPEDTVNEGIKTSIKKNESKVETHYEMSFQNIGQKNVLIEHVGVIFGSLNTQGMLNVFLDSGQCAWCGVVRLGAIGSEKLASSAEIKSVKTGSDDAVIYRSSMQTVIYDEDKKTSVLLGFISQKNGMNAVDVIVRRERHEIIKIEAWQEIGVYIRPGDSANMDALIVMEGESPYDLLERYGSFVLKNSQRTYDSLPVVGMMTWYGYGTTIDEDSVLKNAEIIGDLFDGYPQGMQNIMLVDHGWQEDANWGYWHADKERFPHGLKWLSDKLSQYGIQLGIWYTPFCITENAPNYNRLKTLMARDENKEPYKGEACVWGQLPGHKSGNWTVRYFDGALDRVQEKWSDELSDMRRQGVQYWKLDFFSLRASNENNNTISIGELYKRTWDNFREAVGKERHLAPCSSNTNIQTGYADSVRIAADIGTAGEWPAMMDGYRRGMSTIAALWFKNRKFWVNDPDSVQIGNGCSLSEARVRCTVAALSGGHFMLSEDLHFLSEDRIEIVKRTLPAYPNAARPLNLFENPYPDGFPDVWSLPVETAYGASSVLAVFNLSDKNKLYEITPEMLGLKTGTEYISFNWWPCEWLGRFNGPFTINIPSGDTVVLHTKPIGDEPSLVSVSHHITGGYIIENVKFDNETGELSGRIASKAGLNITIFGIIPGGWKIKEDKDPSVTVNNIGGWQLELFMDKTHTDFIVFFENG